MNRKLAPKEEKGRDLAKQVRELLEERGMETYRKVQQAILEEKIECSEIREALKHFLSYKQMGFLVRPTLISLGCEAVGGDAGLVSDVAVPLVLLSGGMDIHDDIIDDSRTQDSSLTVFGRFKRDVSLLTGDALLFQGLVMWHKLAEKLELKRFIKMTNMLKEAFFEVGDSEALELGLVGRIDVEPERYLQIIRKKAADIGLLFRIGATLGNGPQAEIEALSEYGRFLGMLWVLGDDLSDIFDPKEMARRANNGCLPLPVLYGLRNPEFASQLRKILLKKSITQTNAKAIFQLTKNADGLKQTRDLMKDNASQALEEAKGFRNIEKLKLLVQASLEPFIKK
jgi:geranylgeranyl pyrophosphate synthase